MAQSGTPFEAWLYTKGRFDAAQYNGQTLPSNGETQIYLRGEYGAANGLGINPFSVDPVAGTFSISTGAMPAGADPAYSGNRAYFGGMLSTRNGFADNGYGYWEVSLRVSQADGRWITFWLLPVSKTVDNGGQKVEIDAFEMLDNRRFSATDLKYAISIHGGTQSSPSDTAVAQNIHFSTDAFHTVGILRTTTATKVYLDGVQQGADLPMAAPYDSSDSHYAILSVATGGSYVTGGQAVPQPALSPLVTKTDFKYLHYWPLKP